MENAGGRAEVDVFVVGTLYFDLVLSGIEGMPEPGAEVLATDRAISPGGAANRAVATARLGLRTGLAVGVGDDLFGAHLWSLLEQEPNLDLRWSSRSPDVTTAITVAVTSSSDRRFLTHEAPGGGHATPLYETLTADALPIARATHVPLGRRLPDWVRALRSEGTLVFAGVGWDSTGEWSSDRLHDLANADAFMLNAGEAMAYTRTEDPEAALECLAERVPLVVITQGNAGSIGIDGTTGERAFAAGEPVVAVDPTGAGDVFTAAVMHGTLAGWPMAERLRFANRSAALSVRSLGGATSAPTEDEVRAYQIHRSGKRSVQ